MTNEQLQGSQTAKNGFKNEDDIVDKFNNWNKDEDAKKWLLIMQYNLEEIEYVIYDSINNNKLYREYYWL